MPVWTNVELRTFSLFAKLTVSDALLPRPFVRCLRKKINPLDFSH